MTSENHKVGVCALCGPDISGEKVLRLSHFLPKAVYRYFNRNKLEGTSLLIRPKEDTKVFSMGPQVTQHLLCDACELLMTKQGEEYYLSEVMKIDVEAKTQSPVYKILFNGLIPIWRPINERYPGVILNAGSTLLPEIESHKLYHFVIGMFWKATFKGWKHCPPVPLDSSVVEQMRRFLLGGDFLQNYIVKIVPSFWNAKFVASYPTMVGTQLFFSIQSFDFYLEKSDGDFESAMSQGGVPIFYSIDHKRSHMAYLGAVTNYKRAKQTNSALSTQLTWLND
ncbi:hypothetical protein PS634_00132 [Pseudomonas fluorescens]|nr:hypothetical protein PS634_00132 [Pseudomonas fluorescens]